MEKDRNGNKGDGQGAKNFPLTILIKISLNVSVNFSGVVRKREKNIYCFCFPIFFFL
jgi:hypothetical protein